ncbi:Putative F-box-like domain superfamily protein [Septoria linicola]|uniref:F-box-like domain superfamily protein n=1 Tax=Septoria linicola TaxID=215465 RepID=A0A9Q9AVJ2_9PEZI|nr:Putative F-box-like domain superfamily protein [Septoria linicola]
MNEPSAGALQNGDRPDPAPELSTEKPLSSVQRTFGVVELLEQVLVWLDLNDLVHVGWVCKLRHEVIEESQLLRQNRLLEPTHAHEWLIPNEYCKLARSSFVITEPRDESYVLAVSKIHPALTSAAPFVERSSQYGKYLELVIKLPVLRE